MGITVASRSAAFATPPRVSEVSERTLSITRVLAALACVVALQLSPALAGRFTFTAQLLVTVYLTHCTVALLLVQVYPDCRPNFLLLVHASDVVWPALISLYTGGPRSAFLVLFAIPVVAAAFRWGIHETLATALASVLILVFEAVFASSGWGRRFGLIHGRLHLGAFVLEIACFVGLAGVLGHLAEREKTLRGEVSALRGIVRQANPEAGVNQTVEEALSAILRQFGADRIILALHPLGVTRGLLWSGSRSGEARVSFTFDEVEPAEAARYFFPMPGHTWHLQKPGRGERYQLLALDAEGRRMEKVSCSLPGGLFSPNPFRSMAGARFMLGNEWSGRVFLFDFRSPFHLPSDLRFFQELVGEVAPAVHGVYLLQRSRSRARAVERARVARDLHDGVIQSLIALEMQVDVLRRQAIGISSIAADHLENVRGLLRDEVVSLRGLMQELQLDDFAPNELGPHLAEMIERFQRETGIHASFTSRLGPATFSARVSREIAQIVYEALTNVRKHSGAHSIRVALESEDSQGRLVIEDDGKGFEFAGRLSQADLEAAGKGPQVIRKRVRSIRGQLEIESEPSRGSRLEIRFAPNGHG